MRFPSTTLAAGLVGAVVALAPLGAGTADPQATVTHAVAPVSYDVPPVSGDTLSTMNMINGALADVGTLSRDPLDDSGSPEVAAAERRATNMGRNSAALEGYLYEQGVRQEVGDYDAGVRAEDAARDYATDTWIDADDALAASEG